VEFFLYQNETKQKDLFKENMLQGLTVVYRVNISDI